MKDIFHLKNKGEMINGSCPNGLGRQEKANFLSASRSKQTKNQTHLVSKMDRAAEDALKATCL
jgi:hypothetical protein